MSLLITIVGLILFVAIISYPILILPHMIRRPDYAPFDNHLYAHRGLHNNKGYAPENSLKAFRLATEAGYGIELDIRLSKDKIPVVFHDDTLRRICGSEGRVEDYTCKELKRFVLCHSKETIPTLKEALDEVNGKVPIIIEYKIKGGDLSLCEEAEKILATYPGPYCMESFNPLALRWFKKNNKAIVRGQLSTDFLKEKNKGNRIMYWLLSRLLFNRIGKPDFIAYQYKYPHKASLAIVRDLYNLPTAAWTITNQEDLEESKRYFRYIIFDSFIPKL